MSSRLTYYEKLQRPEWQRKRLEIMQRDEFRCLRCGCSESTLHVHHGYYEKGLDPWEYDSDTLSTLCYRCHEIAESEKVEMMRTIAKAGVLAVPQITAFASEAGGPAAWPSSRQWYQQGFADGVASCGKPEPDEDAKHFLIAELAAGSKLAVEIRNTARKAGMPQEFLDAARRVLGVQQYQEFGGRIRWRLASEA